MSEINKRDVNLLLNKFNTLFVNKKEDILKIAKALSSEKRLELVDLSDGRLMQKEIIEQLGINHQATYKHKKVFENLPDHIKILSKIREGKTVRIVKNYDYILIAL